MYLLHHHQSPFSVPVCLVNITLINITFRPSKMPRRRKANVEWVNVSTDKHCEVSRGCVRLGLCGDVWRQRANQGAGEISKTFDLPVLLCKAWPGGKAIGW